MGMLALVTVSESIQLSSSLSQQAPVVGESVEAMRGFPGAGYKGEIVVVWLIRFLNIYGLFFSNIRFSAIKRLIKR